MTQHSHHLVVHRAFLHALVRSLPQVQLYLFQAPALAYHHRAVVQAPFRPARRAHLLLVAAHLRSHLHLVVLLHRAHLASHRVLHLAIRHFLPALRALHSQAHQAAHLLLVAAHLHSHFLHQALHPVTQHFLPALALAAHHPLRALVFKSYRGNIGIQIVMNLALRLLWWDLALVLLVESVTVYSDLDSLVVVVVQMIPGATREVTALSLDTAFQIQLFREQQ